MSRSAHGTAVPRVLRCWKSKRNRRGDVRRPPAREHRRQPCPKTTIPLQELYDTIESQRERLDVFTEVLLGLGFDPLELLEI